MTQIKNLVNGIAVSQSTELINTVKNMAASLEPSSNEEEREFKRKKLEQKREEMEKEYELRREELEVRKMESENTRKMFEGLMTLVASQMNKP